MLSEEDTKAMVEVLEYLKGIRKEDVEKISPKLINYLKENASKDYKPNIDYNKPLSNLKIRPVAKAILTVICYKYWCKSDKEKKLLESIVAQNEKALNDKFNNTFENENKVSNSSIQDEDLIEKEIVEKVLKLLGEKYLCEFKVLKIGNLSGDNFNNVTLICALKNNLDVVFEVEFDKRNEIITYDNFYIKSVCFELESNIKKYFNTDVIIKTDVIGINKIDKNYTINEFIEKHSGCNFLSIIVVNSYNIDKNYYKAYEKIKNKYKNIYLKTIVYNLNKDDFKELKVKSKTIDALSLSMVEKYLVENKYYIQIQDDEVILKGKE